MNYYRLLNIEANADTAAVKRAYFSAVKIHSPDKDPEGFKAIRLAYETLSDQKKRAEYDSYFVLSGDMQDKLLEAREMIRENKYKQAEDFLIGLIKDNPELDKQMSLFSFEKSEYSDDFYTEAQFILADVYWKMKKIGMAKKLCEQIINKNPSHSGTLYLLAKINTSAGSIKKAGKYFKDAVKADPLNSALWFDYMDYAIRYAKDLVPDIFKRAMKQNIDMFKDDYFTYLTGIYTAKLFTDKNFLLYLDKFAEGFIADKYHDEKIYGTIINFLTHILHRNDIIPFLKKILPALEKSKHRKKEDEEIFKTINACILMEKVQTDNRIHEVLVDMTIFFLTEGKDKNELFGMEYYIVGNLSDLRPSIKTLMHEYPDFFKLNQTFYIDVLNEKKEQYLIDKYIGVGKKLKPFKMVGYTDGDGDDETDVFSPVVRSTPKVGRNDPCPCGSGKKYKKCCGR